MQGLHLFVAPNPWRYLWSIHGIIDLLTIIPSLIVVRIHFVAFRSSEIGFHALLLILMTTPDGVAE